MSNPTPILNNINAFDATKGTIISFNIIGGTDIVRSNIVYIYDLSTNDLICTHLYISTESIHELPPNTDSSIVYASGKSSADFVNNKNYYLQIQTFTNTAGTAGGSGMSVAKTFWCLFNPALSVNAIPAAISTTSYNVGATYTTNITDATIPVTNIIQQYKFDLYTATGTLVQTSGNIIGSGEQEGTSTTYNITYNFSGLVVNNSYYVVVTTTSTEGMTVSTQSSTFTVSIDTPTLGEATVVNNACDGYISVTSNLSGEYGGSASGEIATFVTDSVNDVSSLKVTLTPQQDGTPWIGTDHDTAPYLNRAMPSQSNSYNRESGVIVGGTVAWNQLYPMNNSQYNTETKDGVAFTKNNDGTWTINGTATANTVKQIDYNSPTMVNGHKYLYGSATWKSASYGVTANNYYSNKDWALGITNVPINLVAYVLEGVTVNNVVLKPQLIDLTAMFGSTIADYVYSLEQATAGAGVAWFRQYFPKDYYPYDAGTLKSVQTSAHKTYDGDENVIGNYALDSSLTLRGIPKLDASNNLYYDGDTYESDGTVTRKYGIVTFDGSSDENISAGTSGYPFRTLLPQDSTTQSVTTEYTNTFANYLTQVKQADTWGVAMTFSRANGQRYLYFKITDSMTDISELRTYLANHPLIVVYELATPTTEQAQGYTNPQVVDPDGTEEYVTTSIVPVGHDSTYSLVCPISGYDEVSANVVGKNLCDNADALLDLGTGVTYSDADGYYFPRHYDTGSSHLIFVNEDGLEGQMTLSFKQKQSVAGRVKGYLYFTYTDGTYGRPIIYPATANTWFDYSITSDASKTVANARYGYSSAGGDSWVKDIQIELGSTATDYEPYQGQTYTADLPQTVYGGTVDLVSGEVVIDRAMVDMGSLNWYVNGAITGGVQYAVTISDKKVGETNFICSAYETHTPSTVLGYICGRASTSVVACNATQTNVDDFKTAVTGQTIVYELATPITYQLTPQQIQTILGQNNVWGNSGDVEITYNIPITNLLVKRQDVADVSGSWLTLYSRPITQASDMDFTYIDFLNQHGKTYRYALVPLLTQQQGDVNVEIEGGYTVSDDVLSVFDGVFIANSNGSQKLKAATEYGDLETNQDVGVLTTIGGKYPFVVSNSNLNYHSGSISALIVPSDFYIDGNLDRLDIVERREAIEQFLTDKTAKILKDWNGNIWLITFVENVEVSFVDDYGMGLGTLSAKWVEIGDVNDQTDLQQTGLI